MGEKSAARGKRKGMLRSREGRSGTMHECAENGGNAGLPLGGRLPEFIMSLDEWSSEK